MPTMTVKRGTTFRWRLRLTPDPAGLSGAVVAATVRRRTFADDLAVRLLDDTPGWAEISATADATAQWPLGLLTCDVRAAQPGGEVFATETFYLSIIPEVTRD
ncbi:hypothetical protein [Neotabrizicola sp. VNH66]|uniref:hypothetical protein n=1 Tax=Neotabrizicola sp. VNH66 TaxID=3400918 RepID=UPI003BFFCE60